MMQEILIAGQFRVWVEEAPSGSAWHVKELTDSGPNASNAVIVSGVTAPVRLSWPDGFSVHQPGEDPPIFNYYDEHGNGPYWLSVDGKPSDVVRSIGLVPGVGYQHVNIEFEWCEEGEPEPEPEPVPGDINEKLDAIYSAVIENGLAIARIEAMLVGINEIPGLLEGILCELGKIVECECNDG